MCTGVIAERRLFSQTQSSDRFSEASHQCQRGFSNPTPFASSGLSYRVLKFSQTLLSFMAESNDSSVPVSASKGEPKCNQMKHGDTRAFPIYSRRKESVLSIVKGDIQPSRAMTTPSQLHQKGSLCWFPSDRVFGIWECGPIM